MLPVNCWKRAKTLHGRRTAEREIRLTRSRAGTSRDLPTYDIVGKTAESYRITLKSAHNNRQDTNGALLR